MSDPKPNPFRHMGQWYWTDSKGQTHGPFHEQRQALFDLLKWVYPDDRPEGALTRGIVSGLLIELPILIILAGIIWGIFK